MRNDSQQASGLQVLSDAETRLVAGAGGVVLGNPEYDPDVPGGYTIGPKGTGASPAMYAKLFGKWVPLGSEPFIGPAAGELGI